MTQCDQLSQIYNQFPETFDRIRNECQKYISFEVRFSLAAWLESHLINCTNPENFYMEFLEELRKLLQHNENVCELHRLNDTFNTVKNHYELNPSHLYYNLCNYFTFEKQLCDEVLSGNPQPNEINGMSNEIQLISNLCRTNGHNIGQLNQFYETLRFQLNFISDLERQNSEMNRLRDDNGFIGFKQDIETSLSELIQKIAKFQSIVLNNYLKPCQMKYFETETLKVKLNLIQPWFEGLFDALVNTNFHLKSLESFHIEFSQINDMSNNIEVMRNQCDSLLLELIRHSLVLQQQPDQVVKTCVKFQSSVRLLIGKCINAQMSDIKVKLELIPCEVAQEISINGVVPRPLSPNLNIESVDNNEASLMFNQPTNVYSAYFGNLMIKSRAGKGEKSIKHENAGEGVVERKNALLASVKINYHGSIYEVFQVSSPIVVIVHNSQETIAWGTALWDSVFSPQDDPFAKVETGSWHTLAQAINAKFLKDTGRGLTEENLTFLHRKILSPHPSSNPDFITWSQFAKDKEFPLNTKIELNNEQNKKDRFTFWEWLYLSLKLLVNHAAGLWSKGYIEGFIDKMEAHKKLSFCEDGTFIMRFADSIKGAITVAYIESGIVQHIAPNDRKELEARDLIHRLRGLNELKFIYPNIKKEIILLILKNQPPKRVNMEGYVLPVHLEFLLVASKPETWENNENMNVYSPSESTSSMSSFCESP